MEDLSLHNEIVVISHFLLDLGDILAREARHDTVHEGSANVVVFLEPLLEALIVCSEIVFPELDILADAVFEVVSVQENQLARHEYKSLRRIAVEGLIAAEQQLNQLARIGRSRSVGELAAVVEGDTCLGGVGDDETNLRLLCESHERPVLGVRVQRTRDNINTLQTVHCLTVQTALQINVIQAVLTVEPLYHTFLDRLNNSYRTVEIGLCVHVPNNPVHECAEEVTFTKLNDLLGSHALRRRPLVQCFFCHSFKY